MRIDIIENKKISISRQIYEQIKRLILSGGLKGGEKLPSSRALSQDLGLARNTILEAYEQLLAEGYLETRRGSGTVVTEGINLRKAPLTINGSEPPVPKPKPSGQEPFINFRSGLPDLGAFPHKEWGHLYQQICGDLPPSAFSYSEPEGVRELREAIGAYLFRLRGIRVSPARIMIVSGSTQGLELISRLLYQPEATVITEDPAHAGMMELVTRAGYKVRPIPVDEQGLETSRLSGVSEDESTSLAFIYTTPSHQYPVGGILPVGRRLALIDFARMNACRIVEDDYDSEFRYEGSPVASLFELAPETVIYLGTFSKILAPAIRLGFVIVPEDMIEKWKPAKKYTDVHTDALSQQTLAAFINKGRLERHIWKMRKLYKRKRACLLNSLSNHFGRNYEIKGQAAGLHLVAGFPGITFTQELTDILWSQYGLKVVPVERHSLVKDGSHKHEIVLGYSHLSEEEIEEGVRRLKLGLSDNQFGPDCA